MYSSATTSVKRVPCPTTAALLAALTKTKGISFFASLHRDPEQRELWMGAVNKLAEDEKPWRPKFKTKICSEHFVGGQKRQKWGILQTFLHHEKKKTDKEVG